MNCQLLFAAACAIVALACYRDDPTAAADRAPTTQVLLTDSPWAFDSIARVDIYVVSVATSTAADVGGFAAAPQWVTIAAPRRRFNLLAVQQGETRLIGEGRIPAGDYRAVRVVIDTDSSSVTHRDGTGVPVRWPATGEITIPTLVEAPIAISSASANQVVLDVDVGRSFVAWNGAGFAFTPFVRAVNATATGTLRGIVVADPDGSGTARPIPNADVSLFRGDAHQPAPTWALAASGHTDPLGRFTVAFLLAGTYIVRVEAAGISTLGTATFPTVSISAGQTTSLPVALPPRATPGG